MCIQSTALVYLRNTLPQIGEHAENSITKEKIDTLRGLCLLRKPAMQTCYAEQSLSYAEQSLSLSWLPGEKPSEAVCEKPEAQQKGSNPS